MIRTVFACIKGIKASHNKKVKVEPLKATKGVYRHELTKKQQPPCKAVKKRVRFADSEPTILGEDNIEKDSEKRSCISNEFGEKEGFRVKVKLTKEEAAQLLSKCNGGGVLEFKDVAPDLVSIPVNRFSIVSTCTNSL